MVKLILQDLEPEYYAKYIAYFSLVFLRDLWSAPMLRDSGAIYIVYCRMSSGNITTRTTRMTKSRIFIASHKAAAASKRN